MAKVKPDGVILRSNTGLSPCWRFASERRFKGLKELCKPFLMAEVKPDGVIPEMGASCMEELPLGVSTVTAFEDEAVGLALGAIANQRVGVRWRK